MLKTLRLAYLLAFIFSVVARAQFPRTDVSALTPTLRAYPDRVEVVSTGARYPVTASNSLRVALVMARRDAHEVIGLYGRCNGVTVGDGKNAYYQDSANTSAGIHGVAVLGMTPDATIDGTVIVQNRVGATDVNGALVFANLTMNASPFAYGCVQTFMNNRPTYLLEFVHCQFVPDQSTHHNTYSAFRLQGRASFSIRDCTFVSGMKEHGVYFDNWCGDTEVVGCTFDHTGRCAVQATNRIDQGPPQVGSLLIEGNVIKQPLDAMAITCAGQSDASAAVIIRGNKITVDGNVNGSTAGGIIVYGEKPDTSLANPKFGAWPVGATGAENYGQVVGTNPATGKPIYALPAPTLPCVNRCVLDGNQVVGNNLTKQLVAVGSCKLLRVEAGSLFKSNNRNALDVNHQGAVQRVSLGFGSTYRGWQAQGKVVDRTNGNKGRTWLDSEIDAHYEATEVQVP